MAPRNTQDDDGSGTQREPQWRPPTKDEEEEIRQYVQQSLLPVLGRGTMDIIGDLTPPKPAPMPTPLMCKCHIKVMRSGPK